jgi:hypothetical protein
MLSPCFACLLGTNWLIIWLFAPLISVSVGVHEGENS